MNNKILQHKKHLQNMLSLIEDQEFIEGWCPDTDYVKQKESEMIDNYSIELAKLNQLQFEQIGNAKVLGNIYVNETGFAAVVD